MFEPGINEFMPFMLGVAPGRLCRGAFNTSPICQVTDRKEPVDLSRPSEVLPRRLGQYIPSQALRKVHAGLHGECFFSCFVSEFKL